MKKDANGNVTYDGSGSYVTVASADLDVAAYPSFKFTPTQVGDVSFRAQFVPQGGCGYKSGQTEINKTVIASSCVEGLFGEITSAISQGSTVNGKQEYLITVSYQLEDCENSFTGKLQGGLVNGAEVVENGISGTGYIKLSNGNGAPVIVWENVPSGIYTVTYKVARAAGENLVTGTWTYEVAGETIYTKSELSHTF